MSSDLAKRVTTAFGFTATRLVLVLFALTTSDSVAGAASPPRLDRAGTASTLSIDPMLLIYHIKNEQYVQAKLQLSECAFANARAGRIKIATNDVPYLQTNGDTINVSTAFIRELVFSAIVDEFGHLDSAVSVILSGDSFADAAHLIGNGANGSKKHEPLNMRLMHGLAPRICGAWDFAIWHEMGHIDLGHFAKRSSDDCSKLRQMEVDADEYASINVARAYQNLGVDLWAVFGRMKLDGELKREGCRYPTTDERRSVIRKSIRLSQKQSDSVLEALRARGGATSVGGR